MGKLFCVGLNKTGTQTVAQALRVLGLEVVHYGDQDLDPVIARAVRRGEPLFTYVPARYRRADAFADIETLVHQFRAADEQFPGSRFLLTTRDREAWLDSRQRHVEGNQRAAAEGRYVGPWLHVDRAGWLEEWDEHHAVVRSYFADRPGDLLEWDVAADPHWEPLTRFLGRPVPDQPFPWLNRSGAGSYAVRRRETVLRRAARGGRRAARIVLKGRSI